MNEVAFGRFSSALVMAVVLPAAGCSPLARFDGLTDGTGANAGGHAGAMPIGEGGGTAGGGGGATGPSHSDCADSMALLCEDFETGWVKPGGILIPDEFPPITFAIDTSEPHTGAYSAHWHYPATGESEYYGSWITDQVTAPQARLFVRAHYRIPELALPLTPTILELVNGDGDNAGLALGASGRLQLFDGLEGAGEFRESTYVLPQDAWVCLEVQIEAGTGFRVWVNDLAVPDLQTTGKIAVEALPIELHLGIYSSVEDGILEAFDVYVDDVVVDDERIGCGT